MNLETPRARNDQSRKAGIYLIVWGVLAALGLYGIPLIFLGRGVLRRSERCRSWAVCYLLILIGLATVLMIGVFETGLELGPVAVSWGDYQRTPVWMLAPVWFLPSIWCVLVVIALPPLIWLEAPGTRAACKAGPIFEVGRESDATAVADSDDHAARLIIEQEIRNRQGFV
jgi:hypothetical protein